MDVKASWSDLESDVSSASMLCTLTAPIVFVNILLGLSVLDWMFVGIDLTNVLFPCSAASKPFEATSFVSSFQSCIFVELISELTVIEFNEFELDIPF